MPPKQGSICIFTFSIYAEKMPSVFPEEHRTGKKVAAFLPQNLKHASIFSILSTI
jgi:hypothetical protein